MATAAKLGYGTLLKRGDGGSPEVFTTIAEVREISDFGAERELVEVTNHDSANGFREFILGLKDGSEFSVVANYIPSHSTQSPTTGVIADFDNSATKNYQLVFPTNPTETAQAALLCMAWNIAPPIDDAMVLNLTFKVTGNITWP